MKDDEKDDTGDQPSVLLKKSQFLVENKAAFRKPAFLYSMALELPPVEHVSRKAISHDGKLIAGGGNGVIFIWNLEDGQQLQKIEGEFGSVNGIDFSPDDSLLVSGTDDGIVRIWDTSSGELSKSLTGHDSQIADVCFSPDGQSIASGAVNDASIRIWGLP